jgi:hypothetical protein
MTEKQKFYHLYAEVCETLPTSAIDALIRSGFSEASSVQLVQVRQGRQINLPWLVALIRVGLPQYVIPAEWLPVVVPAVVPTAQTLFA